MPELFSGASMHWIGDNLLFPSDGERADYIRHLDTTALPRLAADGAGTAHRLEKMRQSPRRSFGPDYLSVVEFARAPAPLTEPAVPAGGWSDRYEPIWRMTWTRIFDSGAATRPDRVRLIALSPPADASEQEVAEWNRFYNEVHAVEAMQRRRWTRATRWKLDRSVLHPNPGCPTYFVAYEATGFVDATDAEVAAWGPWTEGPPVWKRQVGSWTLDYRIVNTSG